eukprot:616158-Rhodomonas_salina.1
MIFASTRFVPSPGIQTHIIGVSTMNKSTSSTRCTRPAHWSSSSRREEERQRRGQDRWSRPKKSERSLGAQSRSSQGIGRARRSSSDAKGGTGASGGALERCRCQCPTARALRIRQRVVCVMAVGLERVLRAWEVEIRTAQFTVAVAHVLALSMSRGSRSCRLCAFVCGRTA